jgi:septal ring factor EnvC (AmiA/AmiB activator)
MTMGAAAQPPKPPKPPTPPDKPPPATPPATPEARSADPHERINGLRAWLAQVERRLGIRTYIGAALAVLALAAGGAGIYLGLDTRENAATDADVEDLREELTGVRETAAEAAQEDLQSINRTLADLEDRIGRLENEQGTFKDELSVAEDDIQDLRDQISELETDGTGGGGA